MNFSKFFSEQARKPSGIFGQVVMPVVLDIGCGTGKLISNLSNQVGLYTVDDVIDLLTKSGFSRDISLKSKSIKNKLFHCVVAKKRT